MEDINVKLCREVLRLTIIDLRAAAPEVMPSKAWVHKAGRDQWEFHYRYFYWHGHADNAYDARAKGWSAWMTAQGIE